MAFSNFSWEKPTQRISPNRISETNLELCAVVRDSSDIVCILNVWTLGTRFYHATTFSIMFWFRMFWKWTWTNDLGSRIAWQYGWKWSAGPGQEVVAWFPKESCAASSTLNSPWTTSLPELQKGTWIKEINWGFSINLEWLCSEAIWCVGFEALFAYHYRQW